MPRTRQLKQDIKYYPKALMERLENIKSYPMTLLEADSGFGKSTALQHFSIPATRKQFRFTSMSSTPNPGGGMEGFLQPDCRL
ncbi:MAG: hypothetical protein ACLSB9_32655 [Hydrogeniiclostridium mannosilyticum]